MKQRGARRLWCTTAMPKGVHACEAGALCIALRPPPGEGPGFRVPFKCRSRQHPGACQMAWRALLFARLKSPDSWLLRSDPRELVFLTLTLPGGEHRNRDPDDLHREIGKRWNVLRGWLARRCLWLGDDVRMGYVWVRESHRSGVPHFHAAVRSRALAREVEDAHDELEAMGAQGDQLTIAPKPWRDAAQRAGFGSRMDASIVRNVDAVSGYVAKVCGELTKESQLLAVPTKVRCYGASRGFIPPRYKRKGWTGWLESTNTPGVPLAKAAPKTVKAYLRRWTQVADYKQTPIEQPCNVYDTQNPLARFGSVAEAMAWERGNSPSPVARVYELKPWPPEGVRASLRASQDPTGPPLNVL